MCIIYKKYKNISYKVDRRHLFDLGYMQQVIKE